MNTIIILPTTTRNDPYCACVQLAPISVSESAAAAVSYEDDDEDSLEYEDDENARLLDVCIDGDVEDLVALLEEMAADGEALSEEMLNYPDQSGRVSQLHSDKVLHYFVRDSR